MSDTVVYEDFHDGATTSYTAQGWTATRIIKIDGCDASDPAATLQLALASGDVPTRGDDHPSGFPMQADEVTVEAITSNQVHVTVKYRALSALEKEPDDTQPALMTFGSTVQTQQTSTDYSGQPLTTIYEEKDSDGLISGGGGSYPIQSAESPNDVITGPDNNGPVNIATGEVQTPNTIIRFSRREQNPPNVKAFFYMTKTNATACNWGGAAYEARTLLCTRIEGNTNDGGTSYIVEYEFQYNRDTWVLFAPYVLPNNTQGMDKDDNTKVVLGPGDIPPDAGLNVFQMYGEAEFNDLLLTGA